MTPRLRTAELLYRCAQELGLHPTWMTPDLFAISMNGEEKYINFARSPLNSHASASLAKDKYLTRLILERHNMQNIPFARPQTQKAAAEFLQRHGKIIAKPVNGSGARDIHIITEAKQLQTLQISQYILEKYIGGKELRYLVLNGAVIGMYQSKYGTSVDVKRALQCVSYPRSAWDPELVSSSVKIAHALGLKFAAVDYMQTPSGIAYILEVNTTPDLKWFHAPTSGPVIDVARLFLEAIVASSKPAIVQIQTAPLGTGQVAAYS